VGTYTSVDLHIPEARLLADLTGIQADLVRARTFAVTLEGLMRSDNPDWSLVEPLSIAVAVAYSRAFTTGVRTNLKEDDLATLTPAQRDAHQRLRAYRDKHVAHSVNAFEQNQPRAEYCVERLDSEGIAAVGCSHGRVSSLSSRDIEDVIELTTTLWTHVDARIKQERAKLLAIVRKMPLAEVLAGGQGAFRIPDGADVGKTRLR
jgi:hypothetical protein